MTVTAAEDAAMVRALSLASSNEFRPGPNPRVGCVLLDSAGATISEGLHRGAGTPHAEVDALTKAGGNARGATAVVTLEPCDHTGRTGPCTGALIDAGVSRVVFAQADPNPQASNGAWTLRRAGVDVHGGLRSAEAFELNRAWSFAVTHGRPYVTWKYAATLDGRSAAADGSSRWISSQASRADAHRLRARCDAIMVGTNTIVGDDPQLTARDSAGRPVAHQPLRVIVGERTLAAGHRVFDSAAETLHLQTRDLTEVLAELHRLERRHIFLEGGPTLAAAFLRAGLVDEIVAYLAPAFLGSGRPAIGPLGITSMSDILTFAMTDVTVIPPTSPTDDANIRVTMRGSVKPINEEGQSSCLPE
ncbi:bifunctional diaminohydroxyphosphoribosylaminopyrimidine deaminase/5-amino-6-(5-phosphoribosylamino)uracil reductase RibD [Flaviflexus huanghaiensis]|uniref:bifunctional diaminohydroxyphosphoribosylaminopyrimidine deaminase/5-amino-6-(5-phosphoribosylamino)uracil reductase RibD n=1 Tax=Flaviflexus huanghaiensis TaxID=1111473 RepID=UPI0019D6A4B8|nr:bifunctional diaminohydroxyphosphoribosylaminopyrimidine deaminase/5-amino-6-(5-phosphoribosylamino)uracil reductase RibD [Flaviflexus huanghaiensis]